MQSISEFHGLGLDSGDIMDWRSLVRPETYRDLAWCLFNLSRDCVKLFDLSGNLLAINEKGREIYGCEASSALKGLHISHFIDPRYAALCLGHFDRATCGETTSFLIDGPSINGQRRTWRISMQPVRNDRYEVEFVLTSASDIAPSSDIAAIRHEFESQIESQKRQTALLAGQLDVKSRLLSEAHERIKHTERFQIVGQFVGHVIHDINNILAMMQAMVRLLQRGRDGVEKDLIEQVGKSVDRGRGLIRSLLDLSRKNISKPEVFDPVEAVEDISGLIRSLAGHRAQVTFALSPEAGSILADRHQFEIALFNLVSNARDASQVAPRVPEIDVRIQPWREDEGGQSTAPPDHVKISVADKGCGLSADLISRLGEPYFTTKHSGHGTGLGLASVFELLKSCGGRIDFESQCGEGACVSLYIPCARAQQNRLTPDN